MRHRFSSVTGFVLAGGASRRMGQPKALLALGGETMLERQIRLLLTVARSVAVLGSHPGFVGLDVAAIPDEVPDRGPLGGLYTGLRRTRTEFNLFLSCDLPFMQARFLDYLCRRALSSQAQVTLPRSADGLYHPLCAVYRRRGLGAIRKSLAAGDNQIGRVLSRLRCEVIPWGAIARARFPARIFDNMNSPEGYEAAKAALGS